MFSGQCLGFLFNFMVVLSKNINFLWTRIKLKQMREKVVFRCLYQNCVPLLFCCKNVC